MMTFPYRPSLDICWSGMTIVDIVRLMTDLFGVDHDDDRYSHPLGEPQTHNPIYFVYVDPASISHTQYRPAILSGEGSSNYHHNMNRPEA